MERRVTSHTEEEEMNQRRDLLALARKGDPHAIRKLMELYQVTVYSGQNLKSLKVPGSSPLAKPKAPLPIAKKPEPKPMGSVAKKPTSSKSLKTLRPALLKKTPSQKPKQKKTKPVAKKVVKTKTQTKPKTQSALKPKSKVR